MIVKVQYKEEAGACGMHRLGNMKKIYYEKEKICIFREDLAKFQRGNEKEKFYFLSYGLSIEVNCEIGVFSL